MAASDDLSRYHDTNGRYAEQASATSALGMWEKVGLCA